MDENFPWFRTTIDIEVTLKSGSYLNYALVQVPVALPTSNSHTTLLGATGQLPLDAVGLSKSGAFWATTRYLNQPALVRTGANQLLALPYRVEHALSVVSATHAVIAGVRSGAPTISVTTNGSTSWTHSPVPATMTAVAGVYLWDESNGIAVGDGPGNRFGIMKTTNGGTSWTAVSSAPLISGASEAIIPGSLCGFEDAFWFATAGNRVIYSLDGGKTFGGGRLTESGAVIQSLSFRDKQNGTMLYRTSSSPTAGYRIASSVGAGAIWSTNVFDPTTLGITPVAVNSPGKHHVMIGAGSEVFGSDDNGASWQVILSAPSGTVTSTSAQQLSASTLLMGGDGLAQLAYRYSGPNGTKIAEVAVPVVDFDTLDVDRNRQRSVLVRSIGESDVIVDSVTIEMKGATPDSAFQITIPLDDVIIAGTSDQLGVRLYATVPGPYEALVKIYTNATPPVLEATLIGFAVTPVSVQEDRLAENVSVSPNPASGQFYVEMMMPGTVTMLNTAGQHMGIWTADAAGILSIDASAFASGSYSLVITQGAAVTHRTLHIVR